jgi:hypothetical protein
LNGPLKTLTLPERFNELTVRLLTNDWFAAGFALALGGRTFILPVSAALGTYARSEVPLPACVAKSMPFTVM